MTTNKTPIQELIDDLTRRGVFLNPSKMTLLIKRHIDYWAEKEKAFAFDCYKAGLNLGYWNHSLYADPEDRTEFNDFDSFYAKYVSQHTK